MSRQPAGYNIQYHAADNVNSGAEAHLMALPWETALRIFSSRTNTDRKQTGLARYQL
jgi:hypothetical protein